MPMLPINMGSVGFSIIKNEIESLFVIRVIWKGRGYVNYK
jgi:hypothetical protein